MIADPSRRPFCRKRRQFTTALQFGHKFIPMPQAMKIPAAKSGGGQGMGKLEKISAWNLTKVRSRKNVIDKSILHH